MALVTGDVIGIDGGLCVLPPAFAPKEKFECCMAKGRPGICGLLFLFFFFFFFFAFQGCTLGIWKFPGLGSNLQPPTYTTATAAWDLSHAVTTVHGNTGSLTH